MRARFRHMLRIQQGRTLVALGAPRAPRTKPPWRRRSSAIITAGQRKALPLAGTAPKRYAFASKVMMRILLLNLSADSREAVEGALAGQGYEVTSERSLTVEEVLARSPEV